MEVFGKTRQWDPEAEFQEPDLHTARCYYAPPGMLVDSTFLLEMEEPGRHY
jgi:hypothetical protein